MRQLADDICMKLMPGWEASWAMWLTMNWEIECMQLQNALKAILNMMKQDQLKTTYNLILLDMQLMTRKKKETSGGWVCKI